MQIKFKLVLYIVVPRLFVQVPPFIHVGKSSSTTNGDSTTTVTAGATSAASSTIFTGTSSGGILSRAAGPHDTYSEMV